MVDKEIRILTDAGRCCRPVLTVTNNVLNITNDHVIQMKKEQYQFIQYLLEYSSYYFL